MSEELLRKYRKEIEKRVTCSVVDLPSRQDKSKVSLCGIFENARKLQTKRGDLMSIGELRDLTGSVETIFFPEAYQRLIDLRHDLPVFLECSVEIPTDDGGKAIMIVDEVIAFDEIIER